MLLTVALQLGSSQVVAPVATRQIQPEYPADFKAFLIDPARIEVQVDEKGEPFALRSLSSLPDNVVRALFNWRFTPGTKNGHRASFNLYLNLPIQRRISQYLEHSSRSALERVSLPNYDKDVSAVNPKKAAALEKNLIDDPENIKQRAAWLGESYALAAFGENNPDADHARAMLAATNDQRVILSALAAVTSTGRFSIRLESYLPHT